jgi:hypothetical protein
MRRNWHHIPTALPSIDYSTVVMQLKCSYRRLRELWHHTSATMCTTIPHTPHLLPFRVRTVNQKALKLMTEVSWRVKLDWVTLKMMALRINTNKYISLHPNTCFSNDHGLLKHLIIKAELFTILLFQFDVNRMHDLRYWRPNLMAKGHTHYYGLVRGPHVGK